MSGIEIKCPKCGSFYISDKHASCPSCTAEKDSSDTGGFSAAPPQHNPANEADLVECKYCKEIIKSNAIKCKHCGSILDKPQGQDEQKAQSSGVVTIQQTSKGWKAITLCGLICVLLISPSACVNGDIPAGGGILFLGIVLIIIGRVGAWWCHG